MPNSTWKTPTPWSANQLVTANDMNTQINDQLLALKNPAGAITSSTTTRTTTSTTLTNITGLSTSLIVGGGDIMLSFQGRIQNTHSTNSTTLNLAFKVNNTVYDIYSMLTNAGVYQYVSMIWYIPSSFSWNTPINTATQTFSVQWRSSTGQPIELSNDYQFVVREVS